MNVGTRNGIGTGVEKAGEDSVRENSRKHVNKS